MKKNNDVVKENFPWTVIGHFSTYDEAVRKVEEVREPNSDYDFKIKKYESNYRVKRRLRKGLLKSRKSNKKSKS